MWAELATCICRYYFMISDFFRDVNVISAINYLISLLEPYNFRIVDVKSSINSDWWLPISRTTSLMQRNYVKFHDKYKKLIRFRSYLKSITYNISYLSYFIKVIQGQSIKDRNIDVRQFYRRPTSLRRDARTSSNI